MRRFGTTLEQYYSTRARASFIHYERGSIGPNNYRLINHATLAPLAPDWIPALVVPNQDIAAVCRSERQFPVQEITGVTWKQLMRAGKTSMCQHLFIAHEASAQIQWLYQRYGFLLRDRNSWNIMIDEKGKVWQCDLEWVYDAVRNGTNLRMGREAHLLPSNWQPRLPGRAQHLMAEETGELCSGLSSAARWTVAHAAMEAERPLAEKVIAWCRDWHLRLRRKQYDQLTFSIFADDLSNLAKSETR